MNEIITEQSMDLIPPYFLVFDTETIGLEKRFCYDLGYGIYDRKGNPMVERQFIIEQIWNNKPLFETAYYAEKKELYVSKLRGRTAVLEKWGYACDRLIRDIQAFDVKELYAYNSNFDMSVFEFNADWFKTRNPLDYGKVYDIWGYTSSAIQQGLMQDYVDFAVRNDLISTAGNLQNNADAWGKFLFNNMEYVEEHTALEDTRLEVKILQECISRGLEWGESHKACRMLSASEEMEDRLLTVVDRDKTEHCFAYKQITNYKSKGKIVLR